jgi:hypothetical protein
MISSPLSTIESHVHPSIQSNPNHTHPSTSIDLPVSRPIKAPPYMIIELSLPSPNNHPVLGSKPAHYNCLPTSIKLKRLL